MATSIHNFVQDQNSNIDYNGAKQVGKMNVSRADKKGGPGGRKALGDISNSRNPSFPCMKKNDNHAKVISIEKDFHLSSNIAIDILGKGKNSKIDEKGKESGRKALGDVTNSVKSSFQQVPSDGHNVNAVVFENVPSRISEERFLHNHDECIKSQKKLMDLGSFLKLAGLDTDFAVGQSAMQQPSSTKEMEEISESSFEDEVHQHGKSDTASCFSPQCQSPEPPYKIWEDESFSLKLL